MFDKFLAEIILQRKEEKIDKNFIFAFCIFFRLLGDQTEDCV
jgi:hypothetical protein